MIFQFGPFARIPNPYPSGSASHCSYTTLFGTDEFIKSIKNELITESACEKEGRKELHYWLKGRRDTARPGKRWYTSN
jgi:hypothetical protein